VKLLYAQKLKFGNALAMCGMYLIFNPDFLTPRLSRIKKYSITDISHLIFIVKSKILIKRKKPSMREERMACPPCPSAHKAIKAGRIP
jgi:hypothetical protein